MGERKYSATLWSSTFLRFLLSHTPKKNEVTKNENILDVSSIFPCHKYKSSQNKQESKHYTTILLATAYIGNEGNGRREDVHTLSLDFHWVPIHPGKGLGTKSVTGKHLYTFLKSSYPALFPYPLPTQTIPPSKKTNPNYKTIACVRQWGKGSRGDLSYIWTSKFHYIPTSSSKELSTKWNNIQCSKHIYTHTHTPRIPHPQPLQKKETKHLFFCQCLPAMREGE